MDVRSGRPAVAGRPVAHGRARVRDLVTAGAGLLVIALFIASFFTPATPPGSDSGAAIAEQLRADDAGHRLALFLGFLADVAFLVFLAGLWSRLRRAEGDGGLFAGLFAIAGAAFAALIMVSEGFYVTLVTAGALGVDPATLPALAVLNDWAGTSVLPAGVAMFAGAAAAVLTTRALPAWLGWLAAVTGAVLLVGLAGVFEDPAQEGALSIVGFVGFLLFLVWILATSVVLLVRAGRGPEAGVAA
jgi:hypothetical protein